MEQHLPGGLVNAVVRIGDTVRRPPSPNATFVHALLGHFEQHRWDGAPRCLGMDADGREVLSYLDGHVGWAPRQPAAVSSDQSLAEVARLVRQFHDLTAGTPLAGPAEVVCHNDLSPSNGLDDRSRLVETILWWQDRCWRGIEAGAAAGDVAMQRRRDNGAAGEVRAAYAWVTAHRARLEAAVSLHGGSPPGRAPPPTTAAAGRRPVASRSFSPPPVVCSPAGGRPFAARHPGTGARCPPSTPGSP